MSDWLNAFNMQYTVVTSQMDINPDPSSVIASGYLNMVMISYSQGKDIRDAIYYLYNPRPFLDQDGPDSRLIAFFRPIAFNRKI